MKKILSLILALTMAVGLAACGSAEAPAEETTEGTEAGEAVTLTVAATATPHAEILAQVVDVLAEQGITLVVDEYNDYVTPNTAVEEGEVDANFFQHTPYMDQFNADKGTHLVSVAKIHYEPMGIYAGMTASLEELPDGATIAVPNDPTNEARALLLLEAQGLIEVDDAAGLNATPNDITSNPKNLQFKELEAPMLPQTVEEVDLSIINSNYALQGGLNPATDALASEDPDSDAAQTYANIIAVKEGNENNEAIQALVKALQSDAVREYINETYSGAVVPMF
ncbi:MetQ/NlpA family ABC transporter substrate-binding protein [Evtepia sp.]|uniref:MetQ/NlpA family ABC transporter substrate-binding protein n=1 Tax=Evtepia sp. TaxID=2773933 RepID=UPI002A83539B|nr:MetQ/NlpA family ABC transporter substrate-binding protein [Evtepia sp.]MDY4430463.1 MetQ/NlpA family ABC transporter substrate-binding protein [Evtepia sp.]